MMWIATRSKVMLQTANVSSCLRYRAREFSASSSPGNGGGSNSVRQLGTFAVAGAVGFGIVHLLRESTSEDSDSLLHSGEHGESIRFVCGVFWCQHRSINIAILRDCFPFDVFVFISPPHCGSHISRLLRCCH